MRHKYFCPEPIPDLPLEDERSINLRDLRARLNIDAKIFLASTLGGHLPVVETFNHEDFLIAEAILSGREKVRRLPPTINAFTIPTAKQKFILLNRAPYSNIPAARLNLSEEEWLSKSHVIRLHHECAHYETLRIFGGMKNHPLDEILADAIGQIAAFGDFRAERQKIFFGLNGARCDGRLSFYCQKLAPEDRPKVYRAVGAALDILEDEINSARTHFERLRLLACRSIEEILEGRSQIA